MTRTHLCILKPAILVVLILLLATSTFATNLPMLRDIPLAAKQKLSGTLQVQLETKLRMASGQWAQINQTSWLTLKSQTGRGLVEQLVFVHMDAYPTSDHISMMEASGAELILQDWVPPLAKHPTGFFLASVPIDRIGELAGLPFVKRLGNGEEVLFPQNDTARQLTGVNEAVATYGVEYNQGSGIRVAVLDSGVDLFHPDIPTPVYAVDYSEWPDSNFTVGNTVTGHGTHVAGTVLGRGTASDGFYSGMATEAELVFLKIGDDEHALETSACVTHSFIAARDYYDCDVSSMSYGYFNEFLDGSAENEQAIDYVVEDGMLVFQSAGNSSSSNAHKMLTVPANTSSAFVAIDVYGWAAGQVMLVNGIAWDGPNLDDRTLFDITLYDNNLLEMDAMLSEQQQSPRGTEGRYLIGDDLLPGGGTTRYVTITNNSDHEQVFHLYMGVQTLGPYSIGYKFSDGDPGYTVGSPAIADGAIAVAAYNNRLEWVDYEGNNHNSSGTLYDIAYFSSIGPRIDGLQKPDIAGPGRYVASARDQDIASLQPGAGYDAYILSNPGDPPGVAGDYVLFQGTSMSAPAVSGAAAAVLSNWYRHEEFPSLSHMVRQVLQETAIQDEWTGDTPNDIWGYGKVNVLALAEFIITNAPEPSSILLPASFQIVGVYPNPFNATALAVIDLSQPTLLEVNLVNVLGQHVARVVSGEYSAGRQRYVVDGTALASGTYLLQVTANGQTSSHKLQLLK